MIQFIRAIDLRDVAGLVGMASLGTGLAFYDWRVALAVVGALLVFGASFGPIIRSIRGIRNGDS